MRSNTTYLLAILCGVVGQHVLSPRLCQAEPGPKLAITDLAQVDDDFQFQGEYVGVLYEPGNGSWCYGLQVVALGGGRFQAKRYLGGLPGTGWDAQTTLDMTGELVDGELTLVGEDVTIVSDGNAAIAVDTAGRNLGQLTKTQRVSPTMGLTAPSYAEVLFDGIHTDNLLDARVTDDGLLEVGCTTKMPVKDFRLHLEFRTPYMPYASGQGRSNSGVYIQRRYELQILDSFGLEPLFNGCGALYRQQPPDMNMSLPPLSWQTYDIWFTAARFDSEGTKVANARITALHNGVPIHSNREVPSKTGAGRPEGPELLPILLQNHGNPVNFRNVWLVHLEKQPVTKYVSRTRARPRLFSRIRNFFRNLRCRCRLRWR